MVYFTLFFHFSEKRFLVPFEITPQLSTLSYPLKLLPNTSEISFFRQAHFLTIVSTNPQINTTMCLISPRDGINMLGDLGGRLFMIPAPSTKIITHEGHMGGKESATCTECHNIPQLSRKHHYSTLKTCQLCKMSAVTLYSVGCRYQTQYGRH